MFDTVLNVIGVALALFLAGFTTPKVVIYGGLTTGVLATGAPLVPSFTSNDVLSTMLPRLLAMFTVFPRALSNAAGSMNAEYGLVGVIVVVIVGGVLCIPYLIGILCGVRYWPELVLFRLIF